MCVRNPDRSAVRIDRRDVAQNPTALLEIVSDDFPVTSRERWLFCSTHANLTAAAPPVTFQSPCSCRDAHGKARLSVKNDASVPPVNANAIQSLEPRFEITLASRVFIIYLGPPLYLVGSQNANTFCSGFLSFNS